MSAKPPGNRYITKMDYDQVAGYWVRLDQYRCKKFRKFFGKSEYQTWTKCLAAAKAWRDKNWTNQVYRKRRRHRNYLVGHGVHKAWKRKANAEYVYLYWIANWVTNGRRFTKCFSAHKYGYDEAYRLATALRKKNTRTHQRCNFRKRTW